MDNSDNTTLSHRGVIKFTYDKFRCALFQDNLMAISAIAIVRHITFGTSVSDPLTSRSPADESTLGRPRDPIVEVRMCTGRHDKRTPVGVRRPIPDKLGFEISCAGVPVPYLRPISDQRTSASATATAPIRS